MDDITCPRCRTTSYRNPSLRLMVNSCGHALCDACVNLLFIKGSANCPTCDVNLRRNNFRYQVFQDSYVEKEIEIRKKILRDFNRKEEDFETLREYNDYLEEVEEIIFNLANDINIEDTKKKVEAYKKENAELIRRNQGKKSKDEQEIDDLLEEERERSSFRKTHGFLLDRQAAKLAEIERNRHLQLLADELQYSERPADQIVAAHKDLEKRELEAKSKNRHEQEEKEIEKLMAFKQQRQTRGKFSTGIEYGRPASIVDTSQDSQVLPYAEEVYEYSNEPVDMKGPHCPSRSVLRDDGYLHHVRHPDIADVAGGFTAVYPCSRAIQEAFCGLYISCEAETE